MTRPPVPPLDDAAARAKVQAAEDAWNTTDPCQGRRGLHTGPDHPLE